MLCHSILYFLYLWASSVVSYHRFTIRANYFAAHGISLVSLASHSLEVRAVMYKYPSTVLSKTHPPRINHPLLRFFFWKSVFRHLILLAIRWCLWAQCYCIMAKPKQREKKTSWNLAVCDNWEVVFMLVSIESLWVLYCLQRLEYPEISLDIPIYLTMMLYDTMLASYCTIVAELDP